MINNILIPKPYSEVQDGCTWFYRIKAFNDLMKDTSEHNLKIAARFVLDDTKQFDDMDATFSQYAQICQRLELLGYEYERVCPQIKGRFLDNYMKYLNGAFKGEANAIFY